MDFTGKVAISTGAASGLGLLFAENFAELGGNVVLCDVNEVVLNEKVAEINAKEKAKLSVLFVMLEIILRFAMQGIKQLQNLVESM